MAVELIRFELAEVRVAVGPSISAMPLHHIILPLSLIHLAPLVAKAYPPLPTLQPVVPPTRVHAPTVTIHYCA